MHKTPKQPQTMSGIDMVVHAHQTTAYMGRLTLGNGIVPVLIVGRPDGQELVVFESDLFSREVVADILRRAADQLDPSGTGKILDKDGKPILS